MRYTIGLLWIIIIIVGAIYATGGFSRNTEEDGGEYKTTIAFAAEKEQFIRLLTDVEKERQELELAEKKARQKNKSTPTPTPTPIPKYVVKWGDSLSSIAAHFDISVCRLIQVNNIETSIIHAGDELKVNISKKPSSGCPLDETAQPPPIITVENNNNAVYMWPVNGEVSQSYWAGHAAIDVLSPVGTTIISSAAGTVKWAGWGSVGCGLGVAINHPNGSKTIYCHLSEAWVVAGQTVKQGEGIGSVGLTGWTTGPHVHFELWVNGWPQNPLAYL